MPWRKNTEEILPSEMSGEEPPTKASGSQWGGGCGNQDLRESLGLLFWFPRVSFLKRRQKACCKLGLWAISARSSIIAHSRPELQLQTLTFFGQKSEASLSIRSHWPYLLKIPTLYNGRGHTFPRAVLWQKPLGVCFESYYRIPKNVTFYFW